MEFGNIETIAGLTDTDYPSKRNIKHQGTDTVV